MGAGILGTIVKRLAQAVPVVFGVSFITFCLLNLLPGDTALAILGPGATRASVRALDLSLGLNRPFFDRYLTWLGHLLGGRLGTSSITGQSVSSILATRVPVSAELLLLATIFALVLSVPVALLAALRPRGVIDRVSTFVSMAGLSIPGFVIGLVLILVFAVHLGWLPATGFVPVSQGIGSNLKTMVLPSLTLGFGIFAGYLRLLRADLIDQMRGEEYVVIARAKGLSRRQALVRHALRNSLFPLVTLLGLNFGALLGGSVLVEQIFALPGLGQLALSSVQNKDVAVVQVVVVIAGFTVLFANLATDLLYALIDPRVRYGRRDR